MNQLSNFKVTIICILCGLIIYALTTVGNVQLFEYIAASFKSLEKYQADEIIVIVVCIGVGLLIDLTELKRKKDRRIEIQKHKLNVLKATMRTVHDIVNNSLNAVQLICVELEDNDMVNQESLKNLEKIILDTSKKIKTLGDLEEIKEIPIAGGLTGLEYEI